MVGVVVVVVESLGEEQVMYHHWNDDALCSNLPVPRSREQAQATTNISSRRASVTSPLLLCSLVTARVRVFFLFSSSRQQQPALLHRAHLEQPQCLRADSCRETLSRHSSILVAQLLQTERPRNLPHRHDFRHSDSKGMTQVQNPRPDRDRSWGLLSSTELVL